MSDSKEVLKTLLAAIQKCRHAPIFAESVDEDPSPILKRLMDETKFNEDLGADEVYSDLKEILSNQEATAGKVMIARIAGDMCLGVGMDCTEQLATRSDILNFALYYKNGDLKEGLETMIDKVEESLG